MTARSIEAGRAYVRTDADLSPLEKKLKTIGSKFNALGKRISSIGGGFAKAGAGASALGAGIVGPIALAVKKFTSFGDSLDKMAARTGVGVSALSELGFAAEQGGSDLGTVEKGFARLSQTVFDAGRGMSGARDALAALGLTAQDLSRLSPEDQFQAIADQLGKVESASKRGAVAQAIFGKSGRQLLPMLETLRETRREARDLGLVLDSTATGNAAKLADAFNRIKRTIGGAFLQVGAAVAEPLLEALAVITSITAAVNKWVANNHGLVQTIAAIGAGLLAAGAVITTIGVAIAGVGFVVSGIGAAISAAFAVATTAVGAVATAVGFLLSPIGLVAAAIVGLGGYITYVALESTGSLTKLSEMFGSLGSTATTAWSGIVAAVGAGDLETAGQIAFTALEIGWLTLSSTMQSVWNRVSDFFVNTWLSVVETIVQAGASIYYGVSGYFDKLSVALINGFDTAFIYITGAIDTIQTAIAKAIIQAQTFFGLFSKEQSVEIQASLDDDLKRRAEGRESGLGSRFGQRQSGLSSRAETRNANQEQFSDIVTDQFRRRQSSTSDNGLSGARKRLEELQLKLTTQASEAQKKAAQAQTDSGKLQRVEAAQFDASSAIQSTSAGNVGTFVSGVANQISGGGSSPLESLGNQQVDLLGSIDERLRQGNAEGTLL